MPPTSSRKARPSAPPGARRTGVARALSKLGVASRTTAAQWVMAGRVAINGRIVRDPEAPVVLERDRVQLDGAAVHEMPRRYLMLNKPRGLITTARDEKGRDTVYTCLDAAARRLSPVGRLDKASEGLLLFSNDSAWSHRLLDPATHLAKVYHVQVERQLDDGQLARLHHGMRLNDGSLLQVSEARRLRSGEKHGWLEISLHQGRNRHIRRLLEAMDIAILRLIRVAIGPLQLGELAKGASRELSADELRALAAAVAERRGCGHQQGA